MAHLGGWTLRSAHEYELPATPAAAREARAWLSGALRRLGVEADVDVAQLLLTELVTNVVVHARTPMTLRVMRTGDTVRFEVVDADLGLPRQREPADDWQESGFGLRLLDQLAREWGAYHLVLRGGVRKVVWFELPVLAVVASAAGSTAPAATSIG